MLNEALIYFVIKHIVVREIPLQCSTVNGVMVAQELLQNNDSTMNQYYTLKVKEQ